MGSKVKILCRKFTDLSENDIEQLENIEQQLSLWASLADTDVFIDAPTNNGRDSIVLAWACGDYKKSLYKKSVVGEIAAMEDEPAVFQAISSGSRIVDTCGVSQEKIPISQTVVPIKNNKDIVIGVLIMERDISYELQQQKHVLFLTQTADHLSQILKSLTVTGCGWDEWLGSGIFILDPSGKITYANKQAEIIAEKFWQEKNCLKSNLKEFLGYDSLKKIVDEFKIPQSLQFGSDSFLFQVHPLVEHSILSGCVVSVQDITELRQKEKQIDMQSVMIAEINHRVKNTLQNVISLLYMQIRRTKEEKVKEEFFNCINRILAIAKVYEVFTYQSRDIVNLNELSAYIADKIIENTTLPQRKIVKHIEGADIFIHAKQAVPVALVLNELISNAVKHGETNILKDTEKIYIKLLSDDNMAHIRIYNIGHIDNDILLKRNKKSSLGLYLVKLFVCEQLKGQFFLKNKDKYIEADISFPLTDMNSVEEENKNETIIHFNS